MQVQRDIEKAIITIAPVNDEESTLLGEIVSILSVGDKINYRGREDDPADPDKFWLVHLNAGGNEQREVTEYDEGKVTIAQTVYPGGIDFTLNGTAEADKQAINAIRDMCFWGSGGLIYLGSTTLDSGAIGVTCTGSYCKVCGATMIQRGNCEWSTCEACRANCEHNWERGAMHGGSMGDLGVGEFCSQCGVSKPMQEDKSPLTQINTQAERHLQTEIELGLTVLYENSPFRPADVVQFERHHRESRSEAIV